MTYPRFVAARTDEATLAVLGDLDQTNPFTTSGYLEARRNAGEEAWILGVAQGEGDALLAGCGAFISTGRMSRSLSIESVPAVDATSVFWSGLARFCKRERVHNVELSSFGTSQGLKIPALNPSCQILPRSEYLLRLDTDLDVLLATGHRRNIRKAIRAGMELRQSAQQSSLETHHSLMQLSMDRRRDRGESVPLQVGHSKVDKLLVESGTAVFYQGVVGEQVVSSVLVLRAPRGAYYHSAGTTPEGMAIGGSHFTISRLAAQLQLDGNSVLNLGGAEDGSGLARFKEGFGPSRVPLESATCLMGQPWLKLALRFRASLRKLSW